MKYEWKYYEHHDDSTEVWKAESATGLACLTRPLGSEHEWKLTSDFDHGAYGRTYKSLVQAKVMAEQALRDHDEEWIEAHRNGGAE